METLTTFGEFEPLMAGLILFDFVRVNGDLAPI